MMAEHVFDRLTKAQAEERKARAEVQELVDRFLNVAERLRKWQEIGFEGRDEAGALFRPRNPNAVSIRIGELPPLLEIHKAVEKWREIVDSVHALERSLTDEQRHTLRMPPR